MCDDFNFFAPKGEGEVDVEGDSKTEDVAKHRERPSSMESFPATWNMIEPTLDAVHFDWNKSQINEFVRVRNGADNNVDFVTKHRDGPLSNWGMRDQLLEAIYFQSNNVLLVPAVERALMRALIRHRTEMIAQEYEYEFKSSVVFNSSSSASQVYQAEFAPGVKDSFAFTGLAREREATRSEPDIVARFNQVAPWVIYSSAWRPWETVEVGVQNVMQQREDHSNEALSAGMIDAVSIRTAFADVQVQVGAIADWTDAPRVRELRCEALDNATCASLRLEYACDFESWSDRWCVVEIQPAIFTSDNGFIISNAAPLVCNGYLKFTRRTVTDNAADSVVATYKCRPGYVISSSETECTCSAINSGGVTWISEVKPTCGIETSSPSVSLTASPLSASSALSLASPSVSPSASPSTSPASSHSASPSASPSISPSSSPITSPSVSPSASRCTTCNTPVLGNHDGGFECSGEKFADNCVVSTGLKSATTASVEADLASTFKNGHRYFNSKKHRRFSGGHLDGVDPKSVSNGTTLLIMDKLGEAQQRAPKKTMCDNFLSDCGAFETLEVRRFALKVEHTPVTHFPLSFTYNIVLTHSAPCSTPHSLVHPMYYVQKTGLEARDTLEDFIGDRLDSPYPYSSTSSSERARTPGFWSSMANVAGIGGLIIALYALLLGVASRGSLMMTLILAAVVFAHGIRGTEGAAAFEISGTRVELGALGLACIAAVATGGDVALLWSQAPTSGAPWTARRSHAAGIFADGSVLSLGGHDGNKKNDVFRLTPGSTTLEQVTAAAVREHGAHIWDYYYY